MGNAVVWFEVMGKDGSALQSFYSEMFGWEVDANNPMNYGMISAQNNSSQNGNGIPGGIGTSPEGGPAYVTFYAAVDDVEEALKKAEGLGATRMVGPMKVMDTTEIGIFSDPEGHIVGVVKDQPAQG
jgi:predicted enzyme related to lactoylglutathione lyase